MTPPANRDPSLAPLYQEAFLSRLTARLIESGKHKHADFILRIAGLLPGLDTDQKPRVLLARILLMVHPDKIKTFGAWVDELAASGRADALGKLRSLAHYDENRVASEVPDEALEGLDELWEPADADWSEEGDLEEDDEVVDDEVENLSFTQALRFSEYGNVDVEVNYDLSGPEYDELILPELGIEDLTGIRYFTHLQTLDLSQNRIEDIDELGELEWLTELYLSGNRIRDLLLLSSCRSLKVIDLGNNLVSDASSLLELPDLEYVNLTGNPVDRKVVRALEAKGVVVVV